MIIMDVSQALLQRKAVRCFLNKTVEEEKINQILTSASHAPSGVNTQPWQVAVITGETKQQLQSRIEAAFRSGDKGKSDFSYYPEQWIEPFKGRRKACGLQMYAALSISREDKQGQLEQWAANYRAFDAPVMLLFFMHQSLQTGSFLDYGMFLQSVMLAATEQGLSTCPQASLANYPHIIKAELSIPMETRLICGMSLGYEDINAPVNNYRTTREDISSFVSFYK